LDDISKRSAIIASQEGNEGTLLIPEEVAKVDQLLESAKHVSVILKNWDDRTDIVNKIKEDFYPLMAYSMDDPEALSPQIAILIKNFEKNPEDIKNIPMEQGFNILSAIKSKYYDPTNPRQTAEQIRQGQIADDAARLLEKFDLGNVL